MRKRFPKDTDVILHMAMIQELLGQDARAEQTYTRVIRLAPNSRQALSAFCSFLGSKGRRSALIDLTKTVKNPVMPLEEALRITTRRRMRKASRELAEEILHHDPKNILALEYKIQSMRRPSLAQCEAVELLHRGNPFVFGRRLMLAIDFFQLGMIQESEIRALSLLKDGCRSLRAVSLYAACQLAEHK